MRTEHGVIVKRGPVTERHIASTFVKEEGDGGIWISTIRLKKGAGRERTIYETLTFPVPSGIELVKDDTGESDFTERFDLYESGPDNRAPYNISNVRRKDEAIKHHSNAVQGAIHTLGKQAA